MPFRRDNVIYLRACAAVNPRNICQSVLVIFNMESPVMFSTMTRPCDRDRVVKSQACPSHRVFLCKTAEDESLTMLTTKHQKKPDKVKK